MLGLNAQNIELTQKGLEKIMTSSPEMRERLTEIIRKLLWEARNRLALNVRAMYGGERESWRAVRNIVFRKVLGGNLNLLNMKRGTASWRIYQKTRKVEQNPHMRGGNRRRRSIATARREGYEGKARGFILRFQNEGTHERKIKVKTSPTGKRGNRGSIAGAKFFEMYATEHLNVMAATLNGMIEGEMEKMYKEETKE